MITITEILNKLQVRYNKKKRSTYRCKEISLHNNHSTMENEQKITTFYLKISYTFTETLIRLINNNYHREIIITKHL